MYLFLTAPSLRQPSERAQHDKICQEQALLTSSYKHCSNTIEISKFAISGDNFQPNHTETTYEKLSPCISTTPKPPQQSHATPIEHRPSQNSRSLA